MSTIIDIVEKAESSFGIKLENNEAAELATIGDMFSVIKSKIGPEKRGKCLSKVTYFIIKRDFNRIGIDIGSFRLDYKMSSLIPRINRFAKYAQLKKIGQLKYPSLSINNNFFYIMVIVLFIAVLFPIFTFNELQDQFGILGGLLAFSPALAFSAGVMGRHFFTNEFNNNESIGSFTRRVMSLNFKELSDQNDTLNYDEVLIALKEIIKGETGLDYSEIQETSTLTGDLKAD